MEALILGVYRRLDRERIQFDFAIPETSKATLETEVRALGARVFRYPVPSMVRPIPFIRALTSILRERGPFAGVHSHVHYFSGLVLRAAQRSHVPLRIAHSHFTDDGFPSSPLRRVYRLIARRLIDRHATAKLGCSRDASESLFGPDCWNDPRTRVVPNGIDLALFTSGDGDSPPLHEELALRDDEILVGHVGRFAAQKNHRLVIDVFAEAAGRLPGAVLLLIGAGPLRDEIERRVDDLGLRARVRFLGVRRDLPHVLRGLDVLLMPSLYEGFPVVLVEAQATGLPSVASKTISRDVDLGLGLVRFVDLRAAPATWADGVQDSLGKRRDDRDVLKQHLTTAGYDIGDVARTLSELYLSSPAGVGAASRSSRR